MGNTEKLKNYLIDEKKGYLLNDKLSNGKVIMLSGKWGSGKTHFWKNKIINSKNDKFQNIYISLYGKTSLRAIEKEVFTKAYYRSIGKEADEKDIVEKISSTFCDLTEVFDLIDGVNTTTIKNMFEKKNAESKSDKAIKFIDDGLIICFDDFERKSSEINLNDLFGFITNFALQYKAKVIIILNDDVFEGKEKEIFINLKEKSVLKYLMFNPISAELFDMIFDDEKNDYKTSLNQCKKIIKNTFVEVGIINARILIQVLDNIFEWIENKGMISELYLKYFVFTNINFILNHHIFEVTLENINKNNPITTNQKTGDTIKPKYQIGTNVTIKSKIVDYSHIDKYLIKVKTFSSNFIKELENTIKLTEKREGTKSGIPDNTDALLAFIKNNQSFVKSLHFIYCFKINRYRESNNQAEVDKLNEINNFIETGIM